MHRPTKGTADGTSLEGNTVSSHRTALYGTDPNQVPSVQTAYLDGRACPPKRRAAVCVPGKVNVDGWHVSTDPAVPFEPARQDYSGRINRPAS